MQNSTNSSHKRDLRELLKKFDCFGWLPTIRGALSLELTGNFSNILGDVDSHSIVIKNYNGLSSEQYVGATSLASVNDRKHEKKYCRKFRYFFVGSIHNKEHNKSFAEKHNLPDDSNIRRMIDTEGALLGNLFIVVEDSNTLLEEEVSILRKFQEIETLREEYQTDFSIKAESFRVLDSKRRDLVNKWQTLENLITNLPNNAKRFVYSFEIFYLEMVFYL